MIERQSLDFRSLRAFLRSARARVAPESCGFASSARRRVPGLRREEVAELVGVSDAWYFRFETGRAKFSLAALDRLAHVLCLAASERAMLFAFARPELSLTSTRALDDALSGLGTFSSTLQTFLRSCRSATTSDDIGHAATSALHALSGPGSLGYWARHDPVKGHCVFRCVTGMNGSRLAGHVQPDASIAHIWDDLARGALVSESNLERSPSAELQDRVSRVDTRAYAGIAIAGECGIGYLLGVAWKDPRDISPVERMMLETVSCAVEVALRGVRPDEAA